MKSLFKITEETPKASTWVIVIALLTGLADLVFNASQYLDLSEKTVGIIGFVVSAVTLIINTIINLNK